MGIEEATDHWSWFHCDRRMGKDWNASMDALLRGEPVRVHPTTPRQTWPVKWLTRYRKAILLHQRLLKREKEDGQSQRLSGKPSFPSKSRYFRMVLYRRGAWDCPCDLCKKCTFRVPANRDLSEPSMEACGIDVYRPQGIMPFFHWVCSEAWWRNDLFGLVLVEWKTYPTGKFRAAI